MMLFFLFCRSCAIAPSGGSQVDIPDVCRGGGLIQLVQAFPAGASLRLRLRLRLLLPALAQAAHQHALNLLLALFENVLQEEDTLSIYMYIYIFTHILNCD